MDLLAAYYATLRRGFVRATPLDWQPAMSLISTVVLANFGSQVGRSTYTWEFMVNSTGADGNLYFTDNSGYNRFQSHFPYGGTIYYDSGGIDDLGRMTYSPPGGFFNTWHHIAFQSDFTNEVRRIIVDGVVVATAYGKPNGYPAAGAGPYDNLYLLTQQARMGEVRYWNTFRTLAQINADRTKSLEGPEPGLVGCWRLDERGPSGTQILDRSGNNNHGYIS